MKKGIFSTLISSCSKFNEPQVSNQKFKKYFIEVYIDYYVLIEYCNHFTISFTLPRLSL